MSATGERRSGEDRRQRDEPPPHGRNRRTGPRDRRGSHRRAQVREAAAWLCAVAALALAGYGAWVASNANEESARANEVAARTAERVAAQAKADVRANSLASFQGCQRTNRETRPAARAGIIVLRDLVAAVNQGRDPSLQPPAFRDAPAQLEDALRKLKATDCPAAYPEGYAVWIAEGRPAP